jgi:parallel beta-helix repeat protein
MKSTPRRPGPLQGTTRTALAVLLVLSHPLWAATIIVDETSCTLVDAITAANTDTATGGCPAGSGADTIELTTDVVLTDPDNYYWHSDNGLPVVESDVTLEGNGFTIERDAGAPPFRLLAVSNNGTITLYDVALRNGYAAHCGGAVVNEGPATLVNSTLAGNSAPWGGGICNMGAVTLVNSILSGNSANDWLLGGGGMLSAGGGITTLTNSTVSGNSAPHYGGGIAQDAFGHLALVSSTVSGNSGGGVWVHFYGAANLTNSTVSGNSGDGIYVSWYSEVTITNSTVTGNSDRGLNAYYSDTFLRNSIVANNSGENCYGDWLYSSIVDHGNNFDDDDSCGSGVADIAPGVDFDTNLADIGGPTQTHALLPGSVAIDAAGDCLLETDQRGLPRNDGSCDSGSYEFQCSIAVTKDEVATLIWFTPDSSEFDVVAGYLSDLLADTDFSQATCLGTYSASPAVDTLSEPPVGDGRYYLARGLTNCVGAHYGDSSLTPDPRDVLAVGPCP